MGDGLGASELGNTEEQEGDPEEEEDGAEGDGRLVGGDEHDEGEGEPGHQVDAEGVVELACISVGGEDTRGWPEDEGEGDPESTVRRESSCTEGVTSRELPHASKKLDEASDTDGHSDDQVGGGDVAGIDVEEGEDQGRRREGEETERTGVTELPVVDGETGLGHVDGSTGESIGLNMGEVVLAVEGSVLVDAGHFE